MQSEFAGPHSLRRLLDAVLSVGSDLDLPAEHRKFLLALTFDSHVCPLFDGQRAGVPGCYELTPQ